MYLLGYDVGSSSVKGSLVDSQTGEVVCSATSPKKELDIYAARAGWAEQEPGVWWEHVKNVTAEIKSGGFDMADVGAVGISYQMHGLVIVDEDKEVLRPAIIWCDSRAVEIGNSACEQIGTQTCLERLLNSPGNFTASKLKWVMENEPEIYGKIYKMMLPGDYIAMKMSGDIVTTPSGLSEGIMWDFSNKGLADIVLEHYGTSKDLVADVVPTFSVQGVVNKEAAGELGLKAGTKIAYRAGDQPNNALSLNVLNPGEIAATAGTSGVVYGISEESNYDGQSRVNTFVHVNYAADEPRYGVLLCVNGTGILNSWLKHNTAGGLDYVKMNELAGVAPVGCEGLAILPYGNGAERTLGNKNIGASVHGLNFNTHGQSHLLRAGQEGIVFALNYGLGIMKDMGVEIKTVRAGDANMFLSDIFSGAFATVTGACVELYNTDGSVGAARGAGVGAGVYQDLSEAFCGLLSTKTIEPDEKQRAAYEDAYQRWAGLLEAKLSMES